LESPDIPVFRTCFKSFLGPHKPTENPNFVNVQICGNSYFKITKKDWPIYSRYVDVDKISS